MSGRPIKCVVVGDGTGKAAAWKAKFTVKKQIETKFYF